MTAGDLRSFVDANSITKETLLNITILENGQPVIYSGTLEFTYSGIPGISDNSVGVRVQRGIGVEFMPYGPLPPDLILDIHLQ